MYLEDEPTELDKPLQQFLTRIEGRLRQQGLDLNQEKAFSALLYSWPALCPPKLRTLVQPEGYEGHILFLRASHPSAAFAMSFEKVRLLQAIQKTLPLLKCQDIRIRKT